jgi:hypothetical protein
LKLVGRPLHHAGYHPADSADLAAARTILAPKHITLLANRLGIPPLELTRFLSPDEQRQWAFYRSSAHNPREVWRNAQTAWRAADWTDKQAAAIIGVNVALIRRGASGPRRLVTLTFERAARLTTALNIVEGPETFLPSPKRSDQQKSR